MKKWDKKTILAEHTESKERAKKSEIKRMETGFGIGWIHTVSHIYEGQ